MSWYLTWAGSERKWDRKSLVLLQYIFLSIFLKSVLSLLRREDPKEASPLFERLGDLETIFEFEACLDILNIECSSV
jgi:hypothetical protein